MSIKILPAMIAAALISTTALASAQTRGYLQNPYGYTQDVAPGPSYDQGPFVGTFSEGMPWGPDMLGPAYGYGPRPFYGPGR